MTRPLRTVGSSTYEHIKHDIIFGALQPGAKLKLDDLKTRYQASVSTLRETLNRLSSDGFVEAPEQRGFFVKDVSASDLREIADLRILLESSALETSIKDGDDEWEGTLVAAHHKLSRIEERMLDGQPYDKALWKRYDWEFHQALIGACHSRNLLSLHAIIFDKYLRYQMQLLTNRGADAVAEHREMFEAALDRDIGRAKAALERHINEGLKHALAGIDGP